MHGKIALQLKSKPKILTIAGFDPSGGAGILADIKTIENNACLGFAVQTANTIQNEDVFEKVNWVNQNVIFQQLDILLRNHKFDFVKIGLIEDIEFLNKLKEIEGFAKSKIIWDPVLSASSGFNFEQNLEGLNEVLKKIYLITPNWNEIKILSGNNDALNGASELSRFTKVYLKGGHNEENLGKDFLFSDGIENVFNPKKGNYTAKHGSGCVFSSVLTVNLAKAYPENKAILRSKRYIERYLSSSKTKLGHHI